jgi:CRP-like cAMP-binding protein
LILRASTPVALPLGTQIYQADRSPTHAFFVTSGIASITTEMEDGGGAEVGMMGNDGLAGALHVVGGANPHSNCIVQLPGTALRISIPDLRSIFLSSEEIRSRILEFIQEESISLAQIAGCNRLHEAEPRFARWLLLAQDRTGSDLLNFTQEFMAEMIGTRRTTVSVVAGSMQRSGLLEYSRGHIRILNRESLEDAACECYGIIRRLHNGLYRQPFVPSDQQTPSRTATTNGGPR